MTSDLENTIVLSYNAETQVSNSYEKLLERLRLGEKGIIVEIPWHETVDGENLAVNQLVLMEINQHRIFFANPNGFAEIHPGEYGGKPGQGPLRNIEQDGSESLPLEDFSRLFSQGGRAIFALPLNF